MAGQGATRSSQQIAADNAAASLQAAVTQAQTNLKINTITNSRINWQKIITENNTEIKQSQNSIADYQKQLATGKDDNGETLSPLDITGINEQIVAFAKIIQTDNADNKRLEGYITTATNQLLDLQGAGAGAYQAAAKPVVSPGGSNNPGGSGGSGKSQSYFYNAPLVKDAYFNPLSPQRKELGSELFVDAGKYTDALTQAWKGRGGRGTIQMDRTINPNIAINAIRKAGVKNQYLDKNLYGFKFLYNPTTVSMGWGVSAEVNPTYENLGMDAASPMALGLIQSNITFEILLNRIEDFKYISSTGLKDPAIDPYPYSVDSKDLKEIYKKGTMYDLDYLFKVVMGFNATYKSTLNGLTADRGWISNIAVELHLGDGLRYRVRISSLDVNHIIFNERMVPILSKVSMQCTRYYDSPLSAQDKTSIKSSSGGTTVATGTIG